MVKFDFFAFIALALLVVLAYEIFSSYPKSSVLGDVA